MNWFQRHLNWTVIIAMSVVGFVCGFLAGLLDPTWTNEELQAMVFLILWVAQFPVFGWMLVQKNRRLWNLFWLIMPFGWLILLCLKNRSEQKALEAKETEAKADETPRLVSVEKKTKSKMRIVGRIVGGVLMIIGAVIFAAVGFVTLLNQPVYLVSSPGEFILVFIMALPARLIFLLGILLGSLAYDVLKGTKESQ